MTPGSGHPKIIVIGGGAAGMMAAGQAAQCGAEVLLLEKMSQPGRKIGISGKGRCNLTNTANLHEFIEHFGRNGRFLHQSFARFFSSDLISFLAEHGLKTTVKRGGRVFPSSNKALDVVRMFKRWLEKLHVTVLHDCPVRSIFVEGNRVIGVMADKKYLADSVILCTGGLSYPLTGSTGDGYTMARQLGHTITDLRPALIPLEVRGIKPELNGLLLKNASVQLFVDGKKKNQMFGDVLFTGTGLGGPIPLTLSGTIIDLLHLGKKIELVLDTKPALTDQQLQQRLVRDFTQRQSETIAGVLRGLLPKELIPLCLEETQIPEATPVSRISPDVRQRLVFWLKHIRFAITGYRPISEAIITAGGVSLKEIDPKTMQSKLVSGLYLAGEILDLQADTGGFNLQAAFSTGWLAGRSAAAADRQSVQT